MKESFNKKRVGQKKTSGSLNKQAMKVKDLKIKKTQKI